MKYVKRVEVVDRTNPDPVVQEVTKQTTSPQQKRNFKLEEFIRKHINVTREGNILYKGDDAKINRTGSNAEDLIKYILYGGATKPYDEKIFRDFLEKSLGLIASSDGSVERRWKQIPNRQKK